MKISLRSSRTDSISVLKFLCRWRKVNLRKWFEIVFYRRFMIEVVVNEIFILRRGSDSESLFFFLLVVNNVVVIVVSRSNMVSAP